MSPWLDSSVLTGWLLGHRGQTGWEPSSRPIYLHVTGEERSDWADVKQLVLTSLYKAFAITVFKTPE